MKVCLVSTPPTESAKTALSCAALKEAKEPSMPSISGRVRATPPAGSVLLALALMVPVVSHAHSLKEASSHAHTLRWVQTAVKLAVELWISNESSSVGSSVRM